MVEASEDSGISNCSKSWAALVSKASPSSSSSSSSAVDQWKKVAIIAFSHLAVTFSFLFTLSRQSARGHLNGRADAAAARQTNYDPL